MVNELNNKAILAYKLLKAWQASADERAEPTDEQIQILNASATPEEISAIQTPFSVVDLLEFMTGDGDLIDQEAMIAKIEQSEEDDCVAIIDACVKPLELFSRTTPDLCKGFKSEALKLGIDKKEFHILRHVAPNLVASFEI